MKVKIISTEESQGEIKELRNQMTAYTELREMSLKVLTFLDEM